MELSEPVVEGGNVDSRSIALSAKIGRQSGWVAREKGWD